MPTGTQHIGPYQVLGSLGTGGMAEVFKVEHRHLGQIRALKVLRPEISTRPDVVERMLEEARAMGRLRHPAVVEVYDCDVLQDGTAFIAMEYLRGEPLRLWLQRIGKLTRYPRLAAALVGRVAEGLAFAHRQDVVHRDLKAENILLVQDPAGGDRFTLKLLDFGVAKILREERPRDLTLDGCVIGTPTCMAPEQWSPGSVVDRRTDIYGLGCLFFELLCGRPPFVEIDDLAIMRAHCETEAPRVGALEADLPPGFDPLVARMLAKAPDDRPRDLEEVLAQLEALVGRPRARWDEVLRAPPGFPVVVQETLEIATTHPTMSLARQPVPRQVEQRPPVWLLARWGRRGRRGEAFDRLLARLRAGIPRGWSGAGLRRGLRRVAAWMGQLDRALVPADWHGGEGPNLRQQLARVLRGLIPAHWHVPGRPDPRARMALLAGAGAVAASGLVAAVLLLTRDGQAHVPAASAPTPTVVVAPARPRITATPLPRPAPEPPATHPAPRDPATMTSNAGVHPRREVAAQVRARADVAPSAQRRDDSDRADDPGDEPGEHGARVETVGADEPAAGVWGRSAPRSRPRTANVYQAVED
jgi:tRNA A-37 threonylcarbamoyl transferase component Bud32